MKKGLLFVLVLLLFVSCEKSESDKMEDVRMHLTGQYSTTKLYRYDRGQDFPDTTEEHILDTIYNYMLTIGFEGDTLVAEGFKLPFAGDLDSQKYLFRYYNHISPMANEGAEMTISANFDTIYFMHHTYSGTTSETSKYYYNQ